MKAVRVGRPGGLFEITDQALPEPGPGTVRLRVAACGICHSDAMLKEGQWPGQVYPRVPGHEVAGVIDTVGPAVEGWAVGDRVGIGWHGHHCGICEPCRRGDFILCRNLRITGFHFDGGYEQYMIAPADGLARIPEALDFAEAAPLLCAGVTTYNPLRHADALPGDLVAVQGIGGLGHLGIQFARHMGFRVVAVSRGKDKEELARRLGAHVYIDADTANPGEELQRLGGARVILATAPSSAAIAAVVGGLGAGGTLLAVAAAADPIPISPVHLITRRLRIQGWPSGAPADSEDTLNFCALTGIRPMVETFALEDAARAYERMISNRVRFRAVLVNS
jgi:D-arabinose 1-dehydrogenase-like Zn-dependent alcohol dehydrogenase